MDAYKLDDEVRAILPSLTTDERDELERQILDGLHVDALVVGVFDGQKVLLDGYNRHEIGTRHGLPMPVREKKFKSRKDAMRWVRRNQFGRRNMTPETLAYLRGLEYQDSLENKPPSRAQNLRTTAETVAEQHGVSPRTIQVDSAFAEAVDERPAEEKQTILNGQTNMSKQEVINGAPVKLCQRCKRNVKAGQKPVIGCQECRALRMEATPETPAPKPQVSTSTRIDSAICKLLDDLESRIDERARTFGEHAQHAACLDGVLRIREAFVIWTQGTAKTKKFDPLGMPLPANLNTTKFKIAWEEWCEYRAKKRKPVTELAAKKQLAEMAECGPESAIEAINQAIKNDYQGVFPKNKKVQHSGIKSWLENSSDED